MQRQRSHHGSPRHHRDIAPDGRCAARPRDRRRHRCTRGPRQRAVVIAPLHPTACAGLRIRRSRAAGACLRIAAWRAAGPMPKDSRYTDEERTIVEPRPVRESRAACDLRADDKTRARRAVIGAARAVGTRRPPEFRHYHHRGVRPPRTHARAQRQQAFGKPAKLCYKCRSFRRPPHSATPRG